MSQGQGPGGPPRWPGPGGHNNRPQSPFRGPPPRPGWASPIPPRMTQSPPPFLIRPMVGGQYMRPGSPSPVPRTGSPLPPPFGPPPPRWSPAPGTPPVPHPMAPGTPIPHPMMGPRPFFRPIIPSPSPPVGYPPMPAPSREIFSPDFSMQPSYDVEIVYPAGMDAETHMRRQQMSMTSISQDDDENGPSTAELIAAQSQDFVDERLAEYQATIQHLQGQYNTLN